MNVIANSTATSQSMTAKSSLEATVVVLGRFLFAAIFIASAPMHFSQTMIDMAASRGVPLASIAVPAAGLLELVAGLSILFGYRAKIGAWGLVLFLVPVTVMMHPFWASPDKEAMTLQLTMFMKNLSLVGAALLITQFGSGPISLDTRRAA